MAKATHKNIKTPEYLKQIIISQLKSLKLDYLALSMVNYLGFI
jgi:hypothetical protein